MISDGHLKEEASRSILTGHTTPFLRELILSVVDHALRNHYADEYSIKCLQSSVAIQALLKHIGIKSDIWIGATCYAKVSTSDVPRGWNGFWDEDHHVWVTTQFHELVDLTIKEMHKHPARTDDQLPVPALWWDEITSWPSVIKYLPEGRVSIDLPKEDAEDLEAFQGLVMRTFEDYQATKTPKEVIFQPILMGPRSMNELHAAGNPWVRGSLVFQEMNIPHPPWIARRERELMSRYMRDRN